MKRKFLLGATLLLCMGLLTGCGGKDYDFYIFNVKSENADALEKVCKAYGDETGQKIKVFSIGTTDGIDLLRADMNSNNKPAIYSVNAETVPEWEEGGFLKDLREASTPEMRELAESIPQGMRLSSGNGTNYGIPYNVEGYGYIIDTKMVDALFGEENTEKWLEDFKTATYDEFEALVIAADDYIQNGTAGTVQLSGNAYTFQPEKNEISSQLNGVFAVAGAEKWTYGDHMSNFALNAVLDSLSAAQNATDEQVDELKSPLEKSIQVEDLMTSHAAGAKGALKRSPDFINSTTSGYDQAIQIFADHKSIFIKQGNWVYSNIEKINQEIVKTITMLPVKMPFTQEDIKVSGMTVEKFNRSVPEFVPSYYAINKKAEPEEQEKAEQFLYWLNTSKEGQDFIINDFAFIPFTADASVEFENPLNNALIGYLREGNVLSNPFNGAPPTWGQEVYGKILMEQYFIKEDWEADSYEKIADECISQWKALRKLGEED